jgi:hypothetical protein
MPEAEARPGASNDVLIREAIDRLRTWIGRYVQNQLGFAASPNDFTDRLECRLRRTGSQENDVDSLDAAVQNTLRLLVHEHRRSTFRKGRVCVSTADIEEIQDPHSLQFEARIELQSEVSLIRGLIPQDLLPVIDSLYGFVDEEPVSVAHLAKRLGIRRNTLNQRLRRLYITLRAELRRAELRR